MKREGVEDEWLWGWRSAQVLELGQLGGLSTSTVCREKDVQKVNLYSTTEVPFNVLGAGTSVFHVNSSEGTHSLLSQSSAARSSGSSSHLTQPCSDGSPGAGKRRLSHGLGDCPSAPQPAQFMLHGDNWREKEMARPALYISAHADGARSSQKGDSRSLFKDSHAGGPPHFRNKMSQCLKSALNTSSG